MITDLPISNYSDDLDLWFREINELERDICDFTETSEGVLTAETNEKEAKAGLQAEGLHPVSEARPVQDMDHKAAGLSRG